MPDTSAPETANDRCKCGFRAPELGPHPACPVHAVTADDLRAPIADIFLDWESVRWEEDLPNTDQITSATDAVMALVTPELERLRVELANERTEHQSMVQRVDRLQLALNTSQQTADIMRGERDAAVQRAEQAETERDEAQAKAGGLRAENHRLVTERDALQAAANGKALVEPRDLAAVLTMVTGHGDIRVVTQDALDRLFAALKAAMDTPDTAPKAGGQ